MNKKYLNILTILLLLQLNLIIGCTHGKYYISSKPKNADKFKIFDTVEKSFVWKENRIDLKDMSLYLRPYNDIQTLELKTLIRILPFYWNTEDLYMFDEKPFTLGIGINTMKDGFSFNPNKIILHINSKKIPVKYVMSACDTFLSYDDVKRFSKENINMCFSRLQNSKEPVIKIPLSVPANNLWYCYDILFDTKTPLPDENFSISFNGIMLNNVPYNIPQIFFEKGKWNNLN